MDLQNKNIKEKLLKGIFPAVPIPFTKKCEVDTYAQDSYIEYMKTQPADGFAVWAHTGRGLLIDDETREYIMSSWRNAFPHKLMIAGAGANAKECAKCGNPELEYIKRTVKMAQLAKELHADAVLAYAPVMFRGDKDADKKIVEYHKEIISVGLPVILFYLYEEAGGISYSMDVLNELLNMDEVVGIKMATLDSVMTYQKISALIQRNFPEKLLITGEDRFFGYTMMRGAKAALVGIGSACTAIEKNMMNSYYDGEYEKFIELSLKVDKLAECTFKAPMEGYIKRMLVVLTLLGVIPETSAYDPFGPYCELEYEEVKEIESVLKEIGEI